MLANAFHAVTHLFYPALCAGCRKKETEPDELMCISCYNTLPYTGFEAIRDNPVEKLFWGRTPISFASSSFFYVERTPVQRLIHEVKYKENKKLGVLLGEEMGRLLAPTFKEFKIDIMLPMPLHPKKQKKRGFNQASLLCKGISNTTDCHFDEGLLIRNTNTSTQTKKSRIERWENVQDVFTVSHPELLTGKHVVLVDDVITTGASTEACASILLHNKCASVSVCSLAFTL